MIIGTQQDQYVFQRHHDNQRPQDQRQNAENGQRIDAARRPAGGDHGFAERVKRAGADVAVDDTDTAEHQRLEARGVMGSIDMTIDRRRFRGGDYNIARHENGSLKNASLHNSKATRLIALRLKHSLPCFCDQAMQKCINPGLRPEPPAGPGRRNYGFRSGGSAGSSRISVMVTRRLGDSEGSSGNTGWVSAFPETAKMWADGSPSRSRICRTALARSAERSNAP